MAFNQISQIMDIFTDTFPVLVAFENLNMLENLQIAKKALNGLSGIYAFVHIETGACYIGSSVDLYGRIMDHIYNSSNPHLHNAITKYGLSSFAFVILEYCLSSDLLKREQHFLDLLDTLSKELCYNIARVAEAAFKGLTHTPESRALISDAKLGDNNPIYGKVTAEGANAFPSGANNPMYGKVSASAFQSGHVPANAMTINVYDIDNVLVHSFPSQVAAAEWLSVNHSTVSRYIKSGKLWNKLYTFRKSTY
jgi:group I intron endonuclease